jgi:hypothetical protein
MSNKLIRTGLCLVLFINLRFGKLYAAIKKLSGTWKEKPI